MPRIGSLDFKSSIQNVAFSLFWNTFSRRMYTCKHSGSEDVLDLETASEKDNGQIRDDYNISTPPINDIYVCVDMFVLQLHLSDQLCHCLLSCGLF